MEQSKVKKRKISWQKIFVLLSILFIVGCIIYYGSRLIKYYKIYNPSVSKNGDTVEMFASYISKNSQIVYENDGLYSQNGGYVYRGSDVDNYVKFSGLIFRIVKINADNSVRLVLDDEINILKWDTSTGYTKYTDSDINKYLNDKFLSVLDKDYLINSSVCEDKVNDVSNVTCGTINSDYMVTLLDITDYLNSKVSGTYIDNHDIWLSSRSNDKVWYASEGKLSLVTEDSMYYVKPVITLKNSVTLKGGKGNIDDPYVIGDNKSLIGSYVTLGDDNWIIYLNDGDNLKLVMDKKLSSSRLFDDDSNEYNLSEENNIGYYLNNTFLDSLSYKDDLIKADWYIGGYDSSYNNITREKVNSYVGMQNISDLKFNSDINNYYLTTPSKDGRVYLYSDYTLDSKVGIARGIRPTISINKSILKSGKGTLVDPYKVGE